MGNNCIYRFSKEIISYFICRQCVGKLLFRRKVNSLFQYHESWYNIIINNLRSNFFIREPFKIGMFIPNTIICNKIINLIIYISTRCTPQAALVSQDWPGFTSNGDGVKNPDLPSRAIGEVVSGVAQLHPASPMCTPMS